MREVDQALARAYARRPSETGRSASTPPPPHFSVEPNPAPPPFTDEKRGIGLDWPETVLALERSHGDRFAKMAEGLELIRAEQHLKVLLFTSCHRAEGRTTLVLALARALSRRPGRTLLVDADLTGPMLARQLGLRPFVGLDDVVQDGVPVSDALVEAPDDHLTLLPMRAAVAHPKEFLANPAWSCMLARLRREFDFILVDGSPIFTGLSATVMHKSVDGAILVQHKGITKDRALRRAEEVLEAGGIPLLGLAETFV